jgi:hypothetical protein
MQNVASHATFLKRNGPYGPPLASQTREKQMARKREPNGVEPDFTEDDIQREQFGPRGVPGAPDPAKMTPQREKKTLKYIDPGHTS